MIYGVEIATSMLITPPSAAIIVWRRRKPLQRSVCGTHDRLPQKIPAMRQMIWIYLVNVPSAYTGVGLSDHPLVTFQRGLII